MAIFTIRRKNRAQRALDKLNREKALARQTLALEGQLAIGREQIKLMERTQKKLVAAEIKGLKAGVKKSLPDVLKARQDSGQKQMSSYLNTVKQRALSSSM